MKRDYPCVETNLSKIIHNTKQIISLCGKKGINVAAVTKVFCAKKPIVSAMLKAGIEIVGDSRIENLKNMQDLECRKMLLRIPMGSHADEVVQFADISLNSELETIKKLSNAAKSLNKIHNIILMIDLGDLREGLLEQDALDTIGQIIKLENIKLYGLGTNLTCYGGVIPDGNNLGRLINLKKKAEEQFDIELPVISGGNSSSLYMVINGNILEGVNQLRIGEAIVLGRETSFGDSVPGCYKDSFILKGEIVETKMKPSIPEGNIGMDAFGQKPHFEDRGIIKRAIVAVGRQDVNIGGLTPIDSKIDILGASSDHLILDVTNSDNDYKVGDIVDFYMDYGCMLAAMTSPYVKNYYIE